MVRLPNAGGALHDADALHLFPAVHLPLCGDAERAGVGNHTSLWVCQLRMLLFPRPDFHELLLGR
eukprot:724777-Alexandrium_andersonii.AAC.1